DGAPFGANGFANADFARPFRDRNEHDVHNPDAADEKRQAGNEQPDAGDGSSDLMKHVDELVLLIDGKIVGVGGSQVTDLAHRAAHFFFRILQLFELLDLDLDLIIRVTPKSGGKLLDRNDRLVIDTSAIEKTALTLQHADHFVGAPADLDFLADRRSPFEQIGCHFITQHANRTSAFALRTRNESSPFQWDAASESVLVGRADDLDIIGALLFVLNALLGIDRGGDRLGHGQLPPQ